MKGSLSIQWLRGTPISLIFNTKSNPLGTSTIVSFPLEPGRPGARWEWRGSSDAPVLVYDPEHKGRITSAHQLFGPWAFGGKRVASLEQGTAQSWSNGFEALAQLDSDQDGEINGVELEPIGLWFDENRDAISQPGEVRSSKDVGIVRLRVAFDKTDPKTGDLVSSVGYDRLVDGKVVSGPTVDWIARGANSPRDLAIDAALASSAGAESAKGEFAIPNKSESASEVKVDEAAKNVGRKAHELVAGAWAVRLEDIEPQDGLSGILLFNGGETEELAGISLVELGNRTSGGPSRMVRFTAVKGTIRQDKDSTFALSFVSKSGEAKLENTATIDAGGKLMRGNTVATRSDGTQLRYEWTAKPVPLGGQPQQSGAEKK